MHLLQRFGFNEYRVILSTRDPRQPEKYMGSEQEWKHAQNALVNALKKMRIQYREVPGEAVFYGPKIDLNIVDASGREWQCTTIQFDFNLPKRFRIRYVGSNGDEREVVMIHRALLGSIERFFGILLEHYRGNLPTWLAPVQVEVLPVSSGHMQFAEDVNRKLLASGIRSELDSNTSTIGYKIRQAETQKIPYMAICGKREAEANGISVRKHGTRNLGLMTVEEFIENLGKQR
jgi:threonyl-tRNA synthetase